VGGLTLCFASAALAQAPAEPSTAAAIEPAPAAVEPAAIQPAVAAPAVAAPAALEPAEPPLDFAGADAFEPAPSSALNVKMYGDTLFQARTDAPVNTTFAAAHLDLFATADVERLSFLTEVFFEGLDNEIATDLERLQVSYLVANWLRLRMGRTHTAFGYYNEAYHHGNLFELTTARPFGVDFEDDGGLLTAHLVGAGADGAFDLPGDGQLRYDIEVGNGRLGDASAVALQEAGKNAKLVNLRLRWLPNDGLTLGLNVLHDQFPAVADALTAPGRPKIDEWVGGVHVAYMDHHVHALLEAYAIRHAAAVGPSAATYGGFLELGYDLERFTPYFRTELIHFPEDGDLIFQADGSAYSGTKNLADFRLGVGWHLVPQLVVKLELQRLQVESSHQELATFMLAFGF
jgi:hypothetical protein